VASLCDCVRRGVWGAAAPQSPYVNVLVSGRQGSTTVPVPADCVGTGCTAGTGLVPTLVPLELRASGMMRRRASQALEVSEREQSFGEEKEEKGEHEELLLGGWVV